MSRPQLSEATSFEPTTSITNGLSTTCPAAILINSDKNIPTVSQPANPNRLPAHISAVTGNSESSSTLTTTNTKTPNQQVAKSGGHKHKNDTSSDSKMVTTTHINQQQLHHHQSLPSSSSPNSAQQHQQNQQQQQQSSRVQATNVKGTKKRVSKPDSVGSGGGGGVRMDDMINSGVGLSGGNIVGGEFMPSVNNIRSGISGGHNSSPPQPPSPPQFQTQLVPIQKFSFFKLEINVDTLVRLFIVAMICLMVINAMLYYKLRRIESLADSIRNDPGLMTKVNIPERQFESVLIDGYKSATDRESQDWRSLISKTLEAIEKMENSLRQWDKTLESRGQQQIGTTNPTSSASPPVNSNSGDL